MLRISSYLIRPIVESDLSDIYQAHSDPLVNRYLPYDTWTSFEDAQKWFAMQNKRKQDGIAEQFAIESLRYRKVIGTSIVFNHIGREAYFGYVLSRKYWGQRVMGTVLKKFVPHTMKRLNLWRLNASVEQNNVASQKLLYRLGFNKYVDCDANREPNLIQFQLLRNHCR